MRLTLAGRLAALSAFVSLTVFLVIWGLFAFALYAEAEHTAERELTAHAESFRDEWIVISDGVIYFRQPAGGQSVSDWLRERNLSAAVTTPAGGRIAGFGIYRTLDDSEEFAKFVSPALLPGITRDANTVYRDVTLKPGIVYDTLTVPVYDGQHTIGYLQFAKEAWLVLTLLNNIVKFGMAASGVMLVATALFSFLVIRHALTPLRQLVDILKRFDATSAYVPIRIRTRVTEIRTLIDAFNAMLVRVDEGIRRQRQFIDHASHELRTPLTRAVLLLERASENSAPLKKKPGTLQKIRESLMLLSATVDSLLSLSEIAGRRAVRTEPVSLRGFISRIISESDKADKVRIVLTVPGHIRVHVNPAHFRIALTNIFSNAVKYSKPGGTVSVSARENRGAVTVTVRDTGIGIPPDEISRVFDRFYRSERQRNLRPGTGLGLSLVKEVSGKYGYTVSVRSRLKKGTLVTLGKIPPA